MHISNTYYIWVPTTQTCCSFQNLLKNERAESNWYFITVKSIQYLIFLSLDLPPVKRHFFTWEQFLPFLPEGVNSLTIASEKSLK
jgi:hypothetical protein